MLVVVVWYLHMVQVAVLDLKYFSVLIFWGQMPARSYIFFFPGVPILGQGKNLVPRGISRTKGLPLSHGKGPHDAQGWEPFTQVSGSLSR